MLGLSQKLSRALIFTKLLQKFVEHLTLPTYMLAYEFETGTLRINVSGSLNYEMQVKLPETAVNPKVEYIHYLNGIARIRLSKSYWIPLEFGDHVYRIGLLGYI